MKTVLLLLIFSSVGLASLEPFKFQFKNLFKESIREVSKNANPRIIGGSEVAPHSIPFQVFMELHTPSSAGYCGGSIISANYILTAGHCGIGVVEARIYLGRHNLTQSEPTSLYVVSNDVTVHPNYDSKTYHYDVAVIRLPTPLTFTDAIQPVKLPTRAQENNSFANDVARISGWGRTDGFIAGVSAVLNAVFVPVITNTECARDFAILDNNVCTSGDAMTGSCSGDSGGPLVIGDTQIGVVSFGIQYCLPGYPSAFARISKFLDWIQSNTDLVVL